MMTMLMNMMLMNMIQYHVPLLKEGGRIGTPSSEVTPPHIETGPSDDEDDEEDGTCIL